MKTNRVSLAASVAALFFAAAAGTPANACVSTQSQLRTMTRSQVAMAPKIAVKAEPVAERAGGTSEPSISGYWYVRFTQGTLLVDDGFDLWMDNGTEVLNDTTPPVAGAVCLGVWTKTAPYTYVLKHPSWIFDDTGVNLVSIVIIREQITLNPLGASFRGDSSFDVYDLAGNHIYHDVSTVTGEKMTAEDDPNAIPNTIPGLPQSIIRR